MKRVLVVFLACWVWCTVFSVQAQNRTSITTTFEETLVVCENPITFNVVVKNTSAVTLYNVVLNPKMSNGMKYVASSLSSLPSGVTLINVNSYKDPDFSIGTMAPSDSVTVTFIATANCNIISALGSATEIGNATQVSYTLTSSTTPVVTEYEPSGSDTYNVAYANVGIQDDPASDFMYAHKGTTVRRKLKISNTGTGRLSHLTFKVAYSGTLVYSGIEINGTAVTSTGTSTAREVSISNFAVASNGITGNAGNGDAYLDQNEYFYIDDIALVTGCGQQMTTNYSIEWGCESLLCNQQVGGEGVNNNSKASCDVSTYEGGPDIRASYAGNYSVTFCQSTPVDVIFNYTNIGLSSNVEGDRALDVNINGSISNMTFTNYKIWNYTSNSYVDVPSSILAAFNIYFSNQSSLTTDIDGAGGLDDLDGDGYFDDLPKGAIIKIKVSAALNCPASFSTCNANSTIQLYTYASWISSCGEANNSYSSRINNIFQSVFNSQSISGPTDLANGDVGRYEFIVNRTTNINEIFSCATTEVFTSTIQLPLGYTYSGANVSWYPAGSTTPVACTYSITAGVMTINGGGWAGKYKINFVMNCTSTSGSATSTMDWNMTWRCGSSCTSCDMKLACVSKTIYNHCILCDGFATTKFSVDRTSLGWVKPPAGQHYMESDFTAKQVHKITYAEALADPDPDKYRLNAAYEYDTLSAVVNGVLSNKTYGNAHVEISYTMPEFYGSPSTLAPLQVLEASFSIKRGTGSPSTCSVTPFVTMTNPDGGDYHTFSYDFEVPNSCWSTFQDGDKVDLYVMFRVKKRTESPALFVGKHEFKEFRARHYALVTVDDEPVKESCQSFGDDMTLIVLQPQIINWETPTYYDIISIPAGLRWYGGDAEDFPNEVRPYAKIREIYYDMPAHWRLAPGARNYNAPNAGGWGGMYSSMGNSNEQQPKVELTAPTLSGQRYTWNRGGGWPVYAGLDNGYGYLQYEFFNFNLIRDCSVGPVPTNRTFYLKYSMYDYTGNNSVITQSSYVTMPFFMNDHSTANYTMSVQAIQEGVSKNARWNITVCNNATVQELQSDAVDRTWIQVEPRVPNITFAQQSNPAKDINTGALIPFKASNTANGAFYEIGEVPQYSCRTIQVTAKYTGCTTDVVDAIDVYSNWSFNESYPPNRLTADCLHPLQTGVISLRYKAADLDPQLTKVNEEVQDVCTPAIYQMDLVSSAYADMSDLKFKVELPDGVTVEDQSNDFTVDLPEQPAAPSFDPFMCGVNVPLEWDLSGCEPLTRQWENPLGFEDGGLVGGQRDATHNKYNLRVKLNVGCDYDPSDPVVFKVSGKTNCGDIKAGGLYDFNRKIRINGLDPLDQMGVDISVTAFDQTTQIGNATVTVCNNDEDEVGHTLPDVDRYLVVYLPAGIEMVGGSASPAAPTTTEVIDGGLTKYSWLLPTTPPFEEHSCRTYTFKIKNVGVDIDNTNNGPCGSSTTRLTFKAVVEMRKTLTCGETTCLGRATTATDTDYLDYRRGGLDCDCITSFSPLQGKRYVLSAWVNTADPAATVPVTTYTDGSLSLAFGGTTTVLGPFYPEGEIIDGWQRIEVVFTVPETALTIEVRMNNETSRTIHFDDIRIHPFNASMKSYVYDPFSLRLRAELDENNYATIYEYDEEGGLVRVKKETERGVMTIRESRTNVKKP